MYEPTPKAIQKEAVRFLHQQFFTTPTWLLDKGVLDKISNPAQDRYSSLQDSMMYKLLDVSRLQRIVSSYERDSKAYSLEEYYRDLKKGVWGELATHSIISSYRRDLQKRYVIRMIHLAGTSSDVSSLTRIHLLTLRKEILAALPRMNEPMSRYHLEDLAERIK